MARAGLQQDRVLALEGFFLKTRHDGSGGHGFVREQVRGAHEDADGHAPLDQTCGESRHHGGGTGVVDAAGEDDLEVFAAAGRAEVLQEELAHGFPEDEAGAWADVAAALPTFEHETPAAVLQEHPEQAG